MKVISSIVTILLILCGLGLKFMRLHRAVEINPSTLEAAVEMQQGQVTTDSINDLFFSDSSSAAQVRPSFGETQGVQSNPFFD